MDITLVRQADQKSEIVEGKKIRYIDTAEIFDISKSALRILYECGKRPLYSFPKPTSNDMEVSVIASPQSEPTCLLCAKELNSLQSANVLAEQLSDVGVKLSVTQLSSLSNASNTPEQKHLSERLIQHELDSLEQKGCRHVIIVADKAKLNDIHHMITGKDLTGQESETTCLWAIRDGKPAYDYDSQRIDYVTEGMLDSRLVSQINGQNCPEPLKRFQGKVRIPIDGYRLYYKIRKEAER